MYYQMADAGDSQMPKPTIQIDSEDASNHENRVQCGASGAMVETVARKPRRRFSAADKLQILEAAMPGAMVRQRRKLASTGLSEA